MKKRLWTAAKGFGRGCRVCRSSISDRAYGGFSLLGVWGKNKTAFLLVGALAAVVVIFFIWISRRRNQEIFTEIIKPVAPEVPELLGETLSDAQIVEEEPSAPSPGLYGKIDVLVGSQQIHSFLITDNPLSIGRDPSQSLVVIPELIVSKLHCMVFARGGNVFVKDLNSTNGIYVKEAKVSEYKLQDNDIVFLGKKGTVKIIYHQ
jgi:hypothetical protein